MTLSPRLRRAALLGLIGVASCDVYNTVVDPFPGLVQTWNLPASSSTISVASLLPSGVTIFSTPTSTPPDSSGFQIDIASVNFSRRVGNDCQTCEALHGTMSNKPVFKLFANQASLLPANVVSATVLTGQVTLALTNNLSFDPLYVNTGSATPQGFLVLTLSSNTQALVIDTIFGGPSVSATASGKLITPFPPGAVINRSYPLPTAIVSSSIRSDVELASPAGDHLVPIDADGLITTAFGVPALQVASVQINVPNANLNSGEPEDLPADIGEDLMKRVIRGALELTISNPFAVAGTANVNFVWGEQPGQVITGAINLTGASAAPQVRTVSFDSTQMNLILCGQSSGGPSGSCPEKSPPTTFSISGGVSSTTPVVVTPKQAITISNRLVLTIRAFGGK